MTIHVQFYSYCKDLTGLASLDLELEEGASIQTLLDDLNSRFPRLREMERSLLIAVGVEYQEKYYRLSPGDEVALFPPVQGG